MANLPPKAGWRLPEWCESIHVSKSTGNNLVTAKMIDSVKVGRMRIITTPPEVFLARQDDPDLSIAGKAAAARAAKPPLPGRKRGRPRLVTQEGLRSPGG